MEYEYIDDPDALESALPRLRDATILGVDTEAAGYHRYHDRISLIQFSSPRWNLLIDPLAVDDLAPLAPILANEGAEKVFHDADFDLRILDRDLGLRVHGLFDTQLAAAFAGDRNLGLGAVVEKHLDVKLPKGFQRADWAERPLSEPMRQYAAMDTAYLPALRDRLREELERLGRLSWAQEEFRRREAARWTEPEDADLAFLRVKGSRDLSPRGLAILRELHAWREGVAAERDLATFRILSNQALIDLALRAPRDIAALRAVGGISAPLVDRRGRELIAAVRRGLAVPDDELPRFPRGQRWERDPEVEERAERIRRLRNEVAERMDLDPGFLISRAVLVEIARRQPPSVEELRAVPEVRDWQIEAFGEELLRALGS